jgi:hypothetical protein
VRKMAISGYCRSVSKNHVTMNIAALLKPNLDFLPVTTPGAEPSRH